MKKVTLLKMALLVSVMSLANQSFALVDSTTDNQLPSMREEWQNPHPTIRCPYEEGMELDSDVDYQGKVSTEYKDEHSDIEEMESGGDPVTGWVS